MAANGAFLEVAPGGSSLGTVTAPRCRPAMASPGAHSRLLGASPPGGYGRNCWARTSGSGTSFRLGVSSRRPALGPTGLRQTRITSNTSCCGLLFPCRKARKASFVTGSQLRVPQLPGLSAHGAGACRIRTVNCLGAVLLTCRRSGGGVSRVEA